MTRYESLDEAVLRQIIEPIEVGEVPDARAAYDVDAIAAEVLGGYEQGYAPRVSPEEFWRIVERHERSEP